MLPMDDGALLVAVGSLWPLWSMIFSVVMFMFPQFYPQKQTKYISFKKKTKERTRELKKRFKADQSFIQFDVTQIEFNYVLILIVNMGICFDPKSSISEAQELIRSIEFLLKKLFSYWVWSHLHMLDYCCSPSVQIIVCWKAPSLPTITSWVRLLAQYKFWRQRH